MVRQPPYVFGGAGNHGTDMTTAPKVTKEERDQDLAELQVFRNRTIQRVLSPGSQDRPQRHPHHAQRQWRAPNQRSWQSLK